MTTQMRTLDDLDISGRRVLLRADLNVPLADGAVADDSRIVAALPTIEELRRRGAAIVLASGPRKAEGVERSLSLAPVAERLRELTDATVTLPRGRRRRRRAPGRRGELRKARSCCSRTSASSPARARTTRGSPRRAGAPRRRLRRRRVRRRAPGSRETEGVAHLLPERRRAPPEREVEVLEGILEDPARPLVAVLGGAKVADKIGVVERFLELADQL